VQGAEVEVPAVLRVQAVAKELRFHRPQGADDRPAQVGAVAAQPGGCEVVGNLERRTIPERVDKVLTVARDHGALILLQVVVVVGRGAQQQAEVGDALQDEPDRRRYAVIRLGAVLYVVHGTGEVPEGPVQVTLLLGLAGKVVEVLGARRATPRRMKPRP